MTGALQGFDNALPACQGFGSRDLCNNPVGAREQLAHGRRDALGGDVLEIQQMLLIDERIEGEIGHGRKFQ